MDDVALNIDTQKYGKIKNASYEIHCFTSLIKHDHFLQRILGGIPLLLPWWPIKPYRPCPNFIANGGRYSRVGQPLDQIAFGRGNINIDAEDDDF